MFKGSGDYWRNYAADEVVCTIDTGVKEEVDQKTPSGYLTEPYSPDLWKQSWNNWVNNVGVRDNPHPDMYNGPSNRTLILYMLQLRRESGLPDLAPTEETRPYLEEAYKELDSVNKGSCFFLKRRSPLCFLSPMHYPDVREYQRNCRNDT